MPRGLGTSGSDSSSRTDLGKRHSMGTSTRFVLTMDRFPTGRGLWSRKVLYTKASSVT